MSDSSACTPQTLATNPSLSAHTPSSQPQTPKPDPHLVLRTLLTHSQSPTLHQRLAQKAERLLLPAEVEEFLDLLRKMNMPVRYATLLVKDEEEFHCMRCHETYRRRDNAGSACCIMHEEFHDFGERWGSDIFHCRCKSCGREGIQDGGGSLIDWPNDGICYEGLHTSDPDEINYDDDNTLTCESVGCPGHEEVHCVRCHENYIALVDNGEACCIEHEVFNRDPERCGDTYRYTCNSCGQSSVKDGEGKEPDWLYEVCYEGKHTTNVEDVRYDGDNTLTCAAKGCMLG